MLFELLFDCVPLPTSTIALFNLVLPTVTFRLALPFGEFGAVCHSGHLNIDGRAVVPCNSSPEHYQFRYCSLTLFGEHLLPPILVTAV